MTTTASPRQSGFLNAFERLGNKLPDPIMIFVWLIFFLMILSQIGGCRRLYEMPAGGGQQKTVAQTVKIQKVIRKKYVVNPFSAIKFNVPPIDDIKLQLQEVTAHQYVVGYGEGTGAGFAGGSGPAIEKQRHQHADKRTDQREGDHVIALRALSIGCVRDRRNRADCLG